MKMEFTKMHGTGNDYVYVNCMEQELTRWEERWAGILTKHLFSPRC